MSRTIPAKTILSKFQNAPDSWFGITYNMNLYRGCQHQCIYCDSRSECYQLGDLADIKIKENALIILEKELKSKRTRATIGFGSMNDPYMPVEKQEELVRGALKLIGRYNFPVHILTKSDMIIRDIDLLDQISKKTYAAASLTITTAKNSGAKYLLFWPGMTLRKGSREYFYDRLDLLFSGIKEKYIYTFGDNYICNSLLANELYKKAENLCCKLELPMKMNFYNLNTNNQLKLNF